MHATVEPARQSLSSLIVMSNSIHSAEPNSFRRRATVVLNSNMVD